MSRTPSRQLVERKLSNSLSIKPSALTSVNSSVARSENWKTVSPMPQLASSVQPHPLRTIPLRTIPLRTIPPVNLVVPSLPQKRSAVRTTISAGTAQVPTTKSYSARISQILRLLPLHHQSRFSRKTRTVKSRRQGPDSQTHSLHISFRFSFNSSFYFPVSLILSHFCLDRLWRNIELHPRSLGVVAGSRYPTLFPCASHPCRWSHTCTL